MSSGYGYNFYFKDGEDVLIFPITPPSLQITVGSNNKVITLINEGDINVLKSPSLTEIEFEARFPMRDYPYSRTPSKFETYWDKFKKLKNDKKSFRFIVVRDSLKGGRTWETNMLVALEEVDINEDSDEGDDVLLTFKLKQYKEYGVVKLQTPKGNSTTTSTASETRSTDNKTSESKTYKVVSGDTLWGISKKYYGDGSKWKTIYDANKSIIESTAKKYGKASSSNGHWIYPNTSLNIPAL